MKLKYTGSSDSYELSSADLKKAGVEGFSKTSFPKGKAVEVDDSVGQAILSGEGAFAGFGEVFEEATDEDDEEAEPAGSVVEVNEVDTVDSGPDVTPAATDATGDATPSTTPRGGRSTRTRA